jgi:hypothetical protein
MARRSDKRLLMVPMTSSSIAAAGYDVGGRIPRVQFVGGGTYDYPRVPPCVFLGLVEAPSKG